MAQAPIDEAAFLDAYQQLAASSGLSASPDDPRHFYDWRQAYAANQMKAGPDSHYPSKYKKLGHPNLVVDGKDTRSGAIADPMLVVMSFLANQFGGLRGAWSDAKF